MRGSSSAPSRVSWRSSAAASSVRFSRRRTSARAHWYSGCGLRPAARARVSTASAGACRASSSPAGEKRGASRHGPQRRVGHSPAGQAPALISNIAAFIGPAIVPGSRGWLPCRRLHMSIAPSRHREPAQVRARCTTLERLRSIIFVAFAASDSRLPNRDRREPSRARLTMVPGFGDIASSSLKRCIWADVASDQQRRRLVRPHRLEAGGRLFGRGVAGRVVRGACPGHEAIAELFGGARSAAMRPEIVLQPGDVGIARRRSGDGELAGSIEARGLATRDRSSARRNTGRAWRSPPRSHQRHRRLTQHDHYGRGAQVDVDAGSEDAFRVVGLW